MTKHCVVVFFFLTYARRRAHSNRNVDFLLSQMSHKEKNSEKNSSKFSRNAEKYRKKGHKTRILLCIFKLISEGQPPHLLKRIHNYIITNRISTSYFQTCDTCDSKNTKTPVTRAYAYAQEGLIIGIFTFPQTQFLSSVSPIVFLSFPSCIKNEPSLSIKRHVVFHKTSRRFHQNNTLFSSKHHVTF